MCWWTLTLAAALPACTTVPGAVGEHPTTTSGQETDETGTGSTGPGSTGDDPKFDVPSTGTATSGDNPGACQKVDFAFVIDASQSMIGEQMNIIDNFGTFIEGIQGTVAATDYQVGVHTSDDDPMGWNVPGCSGELSALVARTGGMYSSQSTCAPFASGANFMTPADDLATAFACAGAVGTDGGGKEKPMQTVVEVVQESLDVPGGCNEGYLRDDSLLVVVVITDEADGPGDPEAMMDPDGTSQGDPASWFSDIVAARGGVESNVVLLTLVNYQGGPCPPEKNVNNGGNMVELTQMFTHGVVGGVCETNYGPYFQQAIDVIDTACDEYTPVG